MSRMMPARVRAEGIELYKSGKVQDITLTELKLTALVADEPVVYDLDGAVDSCTCSDFQRNHRYCAHIAAIEEYLKYEKSQQAQVESILSEEKTKHEISAEFRASHKFLAEVNQDLEKEQRVCYSLEVQVVDVTHLHDFLTSRDFLAALFKIHMEKAARSYVIRDIPLFLKTIRRGGSYTIGQLYVPQLTWEDFDSASQALLDFLFNMQADGDFALQNSLYRKNGRYFAIPFALVEHFLDSVATLETYEVKLGEMSLNYWSFVDLDDSADIFRFQVLPQDERIVLKVIMEEALSLYRGRFLVYDHTFYRLSQAQVALLNRLSLLDWQTLAFSYDDKDYLAQALQALSSLGAISAPEAFRIHDFTPEFLFGAAPTGLSVSLSFNYGNFSVTSFRELETLEFSRNLRLEKKVWTLLSDAGFSKAFVSQRAHLKKEEIFDFYEHFLPALRAIGKVKLDETFENQVIQADPEISVAARGNLLDISFRLPEVDDNEFAQILAHLSEGATYYVTNVGKFVKLDARFEPIKSALAEFKEAKIKDNHLTTGIFRALTVSKIFENTAAKSFDAKFQQLYQNLTHPESFTFHQPRALTATLRDYQVEGSRWMAMLTHYNLSGILADDMGLGKTVQAITYLLSEFDTQAADSTALTDSKRALIVVPSSLLYNWQSECHKFIGEALDIVVVDGSREERKKAITAPHQVYITSYGSFLKDAADYQTQGIDYLLLDEAQVVKNFNSKTNKALVELAAPHVFALSGTPIENKLDELWAIFNILMPGLLPSRKDFNKMRPEAISRTISPFVLRRKKEEVLAELPEKLEITTLSELTDQQKMIYLAQLNQMQQRLTTMSADEFSRHRIEILAGITRLRQICDTPALFLPDYTAGSGKLESLRALLQQIKDSGRRPLIFSQFTSLFPHIVRQLTDLDLSFYQLTGMTPNRERIDMVRAFNAGSRDVFLISLKAGGVGLNLASSDMVILVDLWWNPAVEEQAISRAHRMGQKNMVEVIRLITKGTIEEKIMGIQKQKKDLFTTILDNSYTASSLTRADINEILGINP